MLSDQFCSICLILRSENNPGHFTIHLAGSHTVFFPPVSNWGKLTTRTANAASSLSSVHFLDSVLSMHGKSSTIVLSPGPGCCDLRTPAAELTVRCFDKRRLNIKC